jgi:DHA3 family macrolide efflux protein-like MFS transporter
MKKVVKMSGQEWPSQSAEPILPKKNGLTGMRGFTIVWAGQMLSLLGTNMTGFALAIWVYEVTAESFRATAFSLVAFFAFAPLVLVSPIAGAIVDRYDRKKVMMLADLAAGLPTVAVLLLYAAGNLQLWHIFVTGAISSSFQAFHFPAYSAAVTMMVHKKNYGRASGMLATAQFAAGIFAPITGALILAIAGLPTVLMIDIITFVTAISMLLFVHVPRPPTTEAGRKGIGSIWKESLYGFRYINERRSLLGLQLTFFCINFIATFSNVVLNPMILARAGDNTGQIILGSVLSVGGIGGIIGSAVMSAWGGPKRRVNGILFGMVLLSLTSTLLMGLGREFTVWALAAFLGLFLLPIINGSSQAIWQSKVAPDVQGRVFATRLLIAQISTPIAMLMAGPLADLIFEPGMKTGGNLSTTFSWLIGTGPGAGMALMFLITGIAGAFIGLGAYTIRAVRDAEDILPDHDAAPPETPEK